MLSAKDNVWSYNKIYLLQYAENVQRTNENQHFIHSYVDTVKQIKSRTLDAYSAMTQR